MCYSCGCIPALVELLSDQDKDTRAQATASLMRSELRPYHCSGHEMDTSLSIFLSPPAPSHHHFYPPITTIPVPSHHHHLCSHHHPLLPPITTLLPPITTPCSLPSPPCSLPSPPPAPSHHHTCSIAVITKAKHTMVEQGAIPLLTAQLEHTSSEVRLNTIKVCVVQVCTLETIPLPPFPSQALTLLAEAPKGKGELRAQLEKVRTGEEVQLH